MKSNFTSIFHATFFLTAGTLMLGAALGCQPQPERVVKVGILTLLPAMEPIPLGFQESMAELGYVDGENIEYVYAGPAEKVENLDAQTQELLTAGVDILVAVTTPGAQAAQRAIQAENVNIPLVFIAVTDPIGAGLVTDLNTHAENITGVMAGGKASQGEGRRLELFLQVVPGMQNLYLPFNIDDPAAMSNVAAIRDAAGKLGITLVEQPVHNTTEEALAVVTPPDGVDGVFLPNDRLIGSVIDSFIQAANDKKLPTSLNNPVGLESGALMAYGPDFKTMGQQAARLAHQIIQGTPASELPVEVPELLMGLNLKTAELIGLTIPDEMLRLAPIIIRPSQP